MKPFLYGFEGETWREGAEKQPFVPKLITLRSELIPFFRRSGEGAEGRALFVHQGISEV